MKISRSTCRVPVDLLSCCNVFFIAALITDSRTKEKHEEVIIIKVIK